MFSVTLVLLSLASAAFGAVCPTEGQFFFPHPTRCAKFIECNDGVACEQVCFGDLIFNPDKGHCDFKENFECEDKDEAVGNCPPVNSMNDYYLRDSQSCTTYYLCNHGEPHQMECPDGLYFNPTHWVCDWPEQAGCLSEETAVHYNKCS